MLKIYSPKLLAIMLHYHIATVVALSAQQLCLGKVGNPLNFGADPCCHGAYRLVVVFADEI